WTLKVVGGTNASISAFETCLIAEPQSGHLDRSGSTVNGMLYRYARAASLSASVLPLIKNESTPRVTADLYSPSSEVSNMDEERLAELTNSSSPLSFAYSVSYPKIRIQRFSLPNMPSIRKRISR